MLTQNSCQSYSRSGCLSTTEVTISSQVSNNKNRRDIRKVVSRLFLYDITRKILTPVFKMKLSPLGQILYLDR